MKLEHLPFLFEINRLQSISAASRTLHMHQTTLSSIVKSIEAEIGYPIFQRSPNGVMLSHRGALYIKYAEEMYRDYQEMIQLTPDTNQDSGNPICLTTSTLLSNTLFPISRMYNQLQTSGIPNFQEMVPSKILLALKDGKANIALTLLVCQDYLQYKNDNAICLQLLGTCNTMLLVSKNHPLSTRATVHIDEIKNEKVVTTKRNFCYLCLGQKLHSSNSITAIPDADLVLNAVSANNMIAFYPSFMLPEPLSDSYAVVELLGCPKENPLYLCLLTSKNTRLTKQEQILVDCIQDYFRPYAEVLIPDT